MMLYAIIILQNTPNECIDTDSPIDALYVGTLLELGLV